MIEFGLAVNMLLNGLVIASTLFLVSSGLSIVFGVSRISNFAHGSLYMLGAYIAYSAIQWMPRTTLGFFAAVAVTAIAVGLIGLAIEMSIFRRLYDVPHHLQLIATFGIFLIVRDVTLFTWGPQELFAPRVPGLSGAVQIFGQRFPEYYLVIMGVSVLVLGALWYIFHHTRWGVLLRAATQDRDMVAALGVDQKWLFTGVFVLSAALAGLAGALDAPRLPASLGMDITIIIEAFAVVVIGGMGSVLGCFLASLLVGILTAVATVYLPQVTLALVFVVMAVVLVVRPKGFFGKNTGASWEDPAAADEVLRRAGRKERLAWTVILALLLVIPFLLPPYWLDTLIEVLIWTFVAWSFYSIAGTGGMMSFGQAAFFGIGVYTPALLNKYFAWPMVPGMIAAPIVAGLAAILVGWFAVRLSGIYFAMLTLAFAQIIWSITFQWFQFTNGELGILNLWPAEWARDRRVYYFLTLALWREPAGGARLRTARGGDRRRRAPAEVDRVLDRRRLRRHGRRPDGVPQRQRVPQLSGHRDLVRRVRDGAPRRPAVAERPDRRRGDLPEPEDAAPDLRRPLEHHRRRDPHPACDLHAAGCERRCCGRAQCSRPRPHCPGHGGT